MAVIYSNTAKDSRMTAIRDVLNGGKLELLEGGSVIATFTLSATSGSVASQTITFSLVANTVAATATTTTAIDGARFRTSANADVITGLTVGIGTGDVQLDNTDVVTGQNITLSSVAITHG